MKNQPIVDTSDINSIQMQFLIFKLYAVYAKSLQDKINIEITTCGDKIKEEALHKRADNDLFEFKKKMISEYKKFKAGESSWLKTDEDFFNFFSKRFDKTLKSTQ